MSSRWTRYLVGTGASGPPAAAGVDSGHMDLLAERYASAARAAQARAGSLRARLGEVARLLVERGARRIWLFGSLLPGGLPHQTSDVDLAVEGLPAAGLMRTLLDVEDLMEAEVDLVRLEEAGPGLRERILAEGQEIDVPH
jgi:predicted nucleotidyltransferase